MLPGNFFSLFPQIIPPCRHVYDVEADKLYSLDFAKYRRFPISHCWDDVEPRLVGCEPLCPFGGKGASGGHHQVGCIRAPIQAFMCFVRLSIFLHNCPPPRKLSRTRTCHVPPGKLSGSLYQLFGRMTASRVGSGPLAPSICSDKWTKWPEAEGFLGQLFWGQFWVENYYVPTHPELNPLGYQVTNH